MATETVTVPVVSGTASFFSKSNVTQMVGVVASLVTVFSGNKFGISPADQGSIVTTILLVQSSIVFVMHRWYTPHIHASSLPDSTN